MDVSIIIVNYNTKDILYNCLTSIYKHTQNLNFEIIVSDNGSTDGSIEMIKHNFPQVILIENNANLGFGAANNRGLKIASGKYIFYLNSDTILLNNAVKIFYDYWENSSEKATLGALGCNLLDENLNITHSYGNFPQLKTDIQQTVRALYGVTKNTVKKIIFNHTIPLIEKQTNYTYFEGEVDYITGADLFLRNCPLAKFDEHFFMYCEETDLEFSLSKKNLQRRIIQGPQIIHLEGATSKKRVSAVNIINYYTTFSSIYYNLSRIYFYKKNHYNRFAIYILKFLTLLIWINPLIYPATKSHIKKLLFL